jgi:streptomycin 6-kinase
MDSTNSTELRERVQERIDAWSIAIERVVETDSSILAFGRRDSQAVVLKVIRHPGEEWRAGEVLSVFEGHGVVRVLDHVDGAVLLDRLQPGTSLVSTALNGNDDLATGILSEVIRRMLPRAARSSSKGRTLRSSSTTLSVRIRSCRPKRTGTAR